MGPRTSFQETKGSVFVFVVVVVVVAAAAAADVAAVVVPLNLVTLNDRAHSCSVHSY